MLSKLAQQADLNLAGLARLLDILEDQGWVTQKRGRYRLIEADLHPNAVPLEAEARRLAHEWSCHEMIRADAEVHGCRRRFLRNYLGEDVESDDAAGTVTTITGRLDGISNPTRKARPRRCPSPSSNQSNTKPGERASFTG